jgi:hypothetical protein
MNTPPAPIRIVRIDNGINSDKVASPAFDQQNHTRLFIEGNTPGEIGWLPSGGVTYYFGDPCTGQYDGPYPASITVQREVNEPGLSYSDVVVYAQSTQRLYALGIWTPYPGWINFAVARLDQFNGPPLNNNVWVGGAPEFPSDGKVTSMAAAFDPVSGLIVVAFTMSGDVWLPGDLLLPGNWLYFWRFDPVFGSSTLPDGGCRSSCRTPAWFRQ